MIHVFLEGRVASAPILLQVVDRGQRENLAGHGRVAWRTGRMGQEARVGASANFLLRGGAYEVFNNSLLLCTYDCWSNKK